MDRIIHRKDLGSDCTFTACRKTESGSSTGTCWSMAGPFTV